jgi:hypothetical protein
MEKPDKVLKHNDSVKTISSFMHKKTNSLNEKNINDDYAQYVNHYNRRLDHYNRHFQKAINTLKKIYEQLKKIEGRNDEGDFIILKKTLPEQKDYNLKKASYYSDGAAQQIYCVGNFHILDRNKIQQYTELCHQYAELCDKFNLSIDPLEDDTQMQRIEALASKWQIEAEPFKNIVKIKNNLEKKIKQRTK